MHYQATDRCHDIAKRTAISVVIIVFLFSGVLFLFVVNRQQKNVSEICDLTFAGGIQLRRVLVARTKAQQAKGLSDYSTAGSGMLFIFDHLGQLAFWMRHTKMPLSIGFITEEGVLFQIEDMAPESEVYHLSMKPAKYALELPQGGFDRAGLKLGSKLIDQRFYIMSPSF